MLCVETCVVKGLLRRCGRKRGHEGWHQRGDCMWNDDGQVHRFGARMTLSDEDCWARRLPVKSQDSVTLACHRPRVCRVCKSWELAWTGADWACNVCGAVIGGSFDEHGYSQRKSRILVLESTLLNPAKSSDRWYAEQTAMVRRAMVTNSPYGKLRVVYDRIHEEIAGPDYMGQRTRRTSIPKARGTR